MFPTFKLVEDCVHSQYGHWNKSLWTMEWHNHASWHFLPFHCNWFRLHVTFRAICFDSKQWRIINTTHVSLLFLLASNDCVCFVFHLVLDNLCGGVFNQFEKIFVNIGVHLPRLFYGWWKLRKCRLKPQSHGRIGRIGISKSFICFFPNSFFSKKVITQRKHQATYPISSMYGIFTHMNGLFLHCLW